ncbi:MAG: S8 family serine peptidase [Bacteroidales bacterium]|nr:S8 family serine peptidase [Bacteroidales bacterium]
MKALIGTCLLALFISGGVAFSQNNFHNTHILDPYNPEYVPGEVLIKFKDEVMVNPEVESKRGNVTVKTGIKSIDEFIQAKKALDIEKVFKETRESAQKKNNGKPRYITDFKGKCHEVPKLYNIYKLKFEQSQDAKELSELLAQDPAVEYAEPNFLVYTMEVIEKGKVLENPPQPTPIPNPTRPPNRDTYPNDPLYQDGSQWYLDEIDAPAAWDSVTGDTSQVIAIIDTGVDWDHPDLDDNIRTNWEEIPGNGLDDDGNGYVDDIRGWDFVNDDNDPNDDNSHGTHVAGIAAAEGNNGIGICGVAWNSQIMPIKMLQSSGTGNSSDLASAIEYASDNGATVINMSLGSYAQSLTVKDALYDAYVTSLLVAAAGNNALDLDAHNPPLINTAHFPGCYPFVLGMEASFTSNIADFSNYDPSGPIVYGNKNRGYYNNYELMGPGVGIISTIPNGNYRNYNGTSMASPIASGIGALYKAYNDTIPNDILWAKMIFGTDNNDVVNAYNALTIDLDSVGPDLRFIEYTLIDTLPGCDNDGRADAGETIQIYYTVKNVGGYADSVWSKIRFGEFEDTTTAIIQDSTSYIGDISTWATLNGNLFPLEITIDSNTAHNRNILFNYEIGCSNTTGTVVDEIVIKIEKGVELSGVIMEDDTLYNHNLYIINNSFRVGSNVTLNIEPGTEIIINGSKSNNRFNINVRGKINAKGSPDSLILIHSVDGYGNGFYFENNPFDPSLFEYCLFDNLYSYAIWSYTSNKPVIKNCIFKNGRSIVNGCSIFEDNVIQNVNVFNDPILICKNGGSIKRNNIFNIQAVNDVEGVISFLGSEFDLNNLVGEGMRFKLNSIENDHIDDSANNIISLSEGVVWIEGDDDEFDWPSQYWGSLNETEIKRMVTDFWDNSSSPLFRPEPVLLSGSDSAHGIVWKIEINGVNPFDESLDPIGSETVKFDVHFNRPMDTIYHPVVGFGLIEPFLQRIVSDSAEWSSDSTIWTAYYTMGLETGDGINTIHVKDARDPDGFEIPPEKYRFKFVIQAAGAASIQFLATPGIGKVELEWPPANTPDVLGYNLYRFYNLTDSTYSDTTLINTELILDTLFTDFNVIPDTTYHYLYSIIGTDMAESDYSKRVVATPFDAANGDANGDLSVNVLDITTIVSYMLNETPQPFLFDAADVNYDGEINVLDIIGCVQIISGKKSVPLSGFVDMSEDIAYYDLETNKITLESEGNLAGLQFEIQNPLPPDSYRDTNYQLPTLKIFSLQKGFEFAYAPVGDKIIGILYSLSGKTLPAGEIPLFRFESAESHQFEITDIFGGELDGDYVPVLKKGEQIIQESISGYDLNIQPNPFKASTTISFTLSERSKVTLELYDLEGKKVDHMLEKVQDKGGYQLDWTPGSVQAGIYICHMEAISVNGLKKIKRDKKIVLMK